MTTWEEEIARQARENDFEAYAVGPGCIREVKRLEIPVGVMTDELHRAINCVNDREVAGIGAGRLFVAGGQCGIDGAWVHLDYCEDPFNAIYPVDAKSFPVYPPFDLSRLFTPASPPGSR